MNLEWRSQTKRCSVHSVPVTVADTARFLISYSKSGIDGKASAAVYSEM